MTVSVFQNLVHILGQEVLPVLGAVLSGIHIPERLAPGRFDYAFNSHNILHVLVIIGGINMHYAAYWNLHWMLSMSPDSSPQHMWPATPIHLPHMDL